MPGTGRRAFYCVLCRKQTNHKERRKVTKEQKQILKKLVVSVCDDDVLCCNCRIKCHKQFKKGTQIKETQNKTNDKTILLPVLRPQTMLEVLRLLHFRFRLPLRVTPVVLFAKKGDQNY